MTISKSKSVDLKFSEAEIKRYQQRLDVTQLKDPAYPLRLRFNRARTKASWHLVTYRGGKTYWRKLGDWPVLTFPALKKQLPSLLAESALSPSNPSSISAFVTVADVLIWYQERACKLSGLSKSHKANIKSIIKCHLSPRLGDCRIDAVTPELVDDRLIMPLQEIRKLPTVRLAFVVLKAAFSRAKKQKRLDLNPMSDIVFSDFIECSVSAREGAIKKMMLPGLLTRLTRQNARVQVLVLLLLCYATRIGETRKARWDQFDFNARTWTIPACNTKSKQTHELPMTKQIAFLLSAYRKMQLDNGYKGQFLFPGQKRKQAICESSASRWISKYGDKEFSAHDFRKVARSVWAELNVDYMVGERLLNHSVGQLDKAYYQTLIQGPKRDAIEQYHDYLAQHGLNMFCMASDTESIPRSFLIFKQHQPSTNA
ncbi:site-specific integrase [Pseudoalteromonas sp. Of7M-16]|uniref:tyrosine-type recombinase/integrase n=1 Tax=Pseudoalteromonas sp. Of7M-16 TaxID=2917756 RepID=UPI001EF4A84E|nr:site-specific integrase [Pseudoalteromonas sp. Of7M-16]MCG7551605.1 tyrosine-type recombinase/integrase [Pseudoalteromonas sp. Of7M-16]